VRVLLTSANFRPSIGGIERFTDVLAVGLAEAGHEVTVLACRKDGAARDEVTEDGVRVVRLPSSNLAHTMLNVPYPVPAPWALPTVRRLVREADVVHVQDALYATSVAALLSARRLGVASVLTQHVPFVPQANVVLDSLERVAISTVGRCARLAGAVATLTPAVADWVRATWDVDAEVMPVGVPSDTSWAEREAVRAAFGLAPDRFIAIFVGRDVAKKGLGQFLSATDDAYDLVAVTNRSGPGEAGARLVPFMSHERLRDLLHAVDAFVLPSVGEGLPVVLVEALHAGLPVVTTPGQGYERYVGPSDALFVPPESAAIRGALHRLIAEPELRASLAARGRAVAELSFGVAEFVSAYEGLYARVRSTAPARSTPPGAMNGDGAAQRR
jgi:glycosyltransferase involved in cell wall biosynthesis